MFTVIGFSQCPFCYLETKLGEKDFEKKLAELFPSWTRHRNMDEITYYAKGVPSNKSNRLETNYMASILQDDGRISISPHFESVRDPLHPAHFSPSLTKILCIGKVRESDELAIEKMREIFKDIIVGETESDV